MLTSSCEIRSIPFPTWRPFCCSGTAALKNGPWRTWRRGSSCAGSRQRDLGRLGPQTSDCPHFGILRSFPLRAGADKDELIAAVDSAYRKELIRISRLIHSKPSAAVREFARAFRIKKDRD